MTDMIKLLLVDDHQMVLEGLRSLLQLHKDMEIVYAATNGPDALAFLETQPANVILLDINLPVMNGFELCKLIKKKYPATKVIALSTHNERSMITRMLQNGASGFLSKSSGSEELAKAIRVVQGNGIYLGEEIQEGLAAVTTATAVLPRLTRREKEVLSLIAAGKSTQEIAAALFISFLTAETHRRNIMQKFGVANVAALIKVAVDNGLV